MRCQITQRSYPTTPWCSFKRNNSRDEFFHKLRKCLIKKFILESLTNLSIGTGVKLDSDDPVWTNVKTQATPESRYINRAKHEQAIPTALKFFGFRDRCSCHVWFSISLKQYHYMFFCKDVVKYWNYKFLSSLLVRLSDQYYIVFFSFLFFPCSFIFFLFSLSFFKPILICFNVLMCRSVHSS